MKTNERIRALREDQYKTQLEIATYLKIDIKTYCRYEKGHHEIKLSILIELAKYYNVSLDYIAGLTDKIKPLEDRGSPRMLSKKESDLIKAYNQHTEHQASIDKLLDL